MIEPRAQSGNVDTNGDIVDDARDFVLDLRRRLEGAICIEDDAEREAHLEAIAGEIDRVTRSSRRTRRNETAGPAIALNPSGLA